MEWLARCTCNGVAAGFDFLLPAPLELKTRDPLDEPHPELAGKREAESLRRRVKKPASQMSATSSSVPEAARTFDRRLLKESARVIRRNASASLIDIGDGIGLVEFHTKANAINDEIAEMLEIAVQEGTGHFGALVIGNLAEHFSAGANLEQLLADSTEGNWRDAERYTRRLQNANLRLKCGSLPVVAAPAGDALGGGCEICLHSAHVRVSAGTRMGLVEARIGLIPAGGGTKELTLRALARWSGSGAADPMPFLKDAFDLMMSGTVSVSGEEALRKFLSPADSICADESARLTSAKQIALGLISVQHKNQIPKTAIRILGWAGMDYFQNAIEKLRSNGTFTEHDALIARHVARVLCGGEQAAGTTTEQHLLDLERESFLFLLGHHKTRERIHHMLKRNERLQN
jgi:3-hydroxyacyl-CoA dehydrogenase